MSKRRWEAMMSSFLKRMAVNAAGLTLGRYATKAALASPAARKMIVTAASKTARALGGAAHKTIVKRLPVVSLPARPSFLDGFGVRRPADGAQIALIDAEVVGTRDSALVPVAVDDKPVAVSDETVAKSELAVAPKKAHPVLKGVALAAGVTAGVVAGAAAFTAFAVAPRFSGNKALRAHWDEFKKYRYAHRGLHDIKQGIPENSLAAFRRAAEHGFGSELDVHLTADGQVVVVHDSHLQRLCGVDCVVEDCTLEQLRTYRLLNTEAGIPTFAEVLSCYDWNGEDELPAPLIVEVKTYGGNAAAVTEQVMKILDRHSVRAAVESFDPMALRWLRVHRPEVLRGQLAENFLTDDTTSDLSAPKKAAGTALFGNSLSRPDFIAYRFEDRKNPFVDLACNKMGAHLVTWTITSEADLITSEMEGAPGIFEGFVPTVRSLIR